jgi:UDP-glucose 4-epimerase
MAEKRVVLITGVAGHWGARSPQVGGRAGPNVIGLDAEPPPEDIQGLDFIQADIRNPLLVDLFKSESVQTVCHLAFVESARLSETAFDLNVMGTLKVMGACVEAGVEWCQEQHCRLWPNLPTRPSRRISSSTQPPLRLTLTGD